MNTDTTAFRALSQPAQALVRFVVENACDYVNDMMIEHGDDKLTVSVGAIFDQAVEFMKHELDPQDANVDLPEALTNAIKQCVLATVGFVIVPHFAHHINS